VLVLPFALVAPRLLGHRVLLPSSLACLSPVSQAVPGAMGGMRGDTGIADWVSAHFPSRTVGNATVYDLR